MSYDLAVYTTRAASTEDLRDVVGTGLHLDKSDAQSATVLRGARRRYSFTIDGPDAVEPEDVPDEVEAVLLGAQFLYMIAVEGSAGSEIPHAVRFARRLAVTLDGAVMDQQTDGIWSRSQSRAVRKPAREERVSTVHVDWYCMRDDVTPDAASLFIRATKRLLPEAMPRRFGEYEPFQGKLADAGADGFGKAWTAATSLLFTAGSGPCIGGHLGAGPSEQFPDQFWSMSLTFLAEPFAEQAWRRALRNLFVALADGLPAFYASADVTAGHIWSGRSLWSDGDTQWRISPVGRREGWTGLPPGATWWSWLGSPFSEYFPMLPADRATSTARGVLYEAAELPDVAGFLPLSTWLPADLFSRLAPNPMRQQPVPLYPASVIPAALQRDP